MSDKAPDMISEQSENVRQQTGMSDKVSDTEGMADLVSKVMSRCVS